jgi:hypothetical protein
MGSPVPAYEFDFALSFAGEDRAYVSRVADALRLQGVNVFYDQFETAALWGKDLYTYLDEIYRIKSRFVIIFSSENYARKMWTNHERQSAQARALKEKDAYLLPVRLDQTEIPGIRPTVAYIDGARNGPEEIARLAVALLAGGRAVPAGTAPPAMIRVPLTVAEQQAITTTRPAGWEYLLFAGGVWRHIQSHAERLLDNEIGYSRSGSIIGRYSVRDVIDRDIVKLESLVGRVSLIMNTETQAWAFGSAGEPGDPARINHMSKRFGELYGELLNWAYHVRSLVVPAEAQAVLALASKLADRPIRHMGSFADWIVVEAGKLATLLREDATWTSAISLEINIELNPALLRRVRSDLLPFTDHS